MSTNYFTVGDLQHELKNLDPQDLIEFEGGLTFSRIKRRGEGLQVLEFCEPQGYLDDSFRRRNPQVLSVFIQAEPFAEGQMVQEVDVTIT